MRRFFVLWVVSACSFSPTQSPIDAAPKPIDVAVDVPPINITWAVDPTSGKGVPESAAKWSEFAQAYHLTSVLAPSHLWLMQEMSNALADTIGGASLSPLNGPGYDEVVPGWTRHAVSTAEVTFNQGFITNSIGNLDGTSYLMLVYVAVAATPSADRAIAGIGGGSDHRYVTVTSAPTFNATGSGGVVAAKGTIVAATSVHPVLIEISASHSTYVVYTDQERLSPAWHATSGVAPLVAIGNATSVGAAEMRYLYAALWSSSAAELSDADAKAMLNGLGWTVTGY